MPPCTRTNSGSLYSARRRRSAWLTVGCETPSRSAARLTLRVACTAWKVCSRLRLASRICISCILHLKSMPFTNDGRGARFSREVSGARDAGPGTEEPLEVSFSREAQRLRLGAGETFHGEGILAITKALLQSGVAYVGGYQGAPVSHLLDVMVQAKPYMAELGVHVEACANEASAAAMLGASIHYPLRGAVTWKSIVGTNVAADALSNLSSPGVTGGALIVVGEDYGEGASVIQERTHAYALKSTLCLFDPRPELQNMVRQVEH